MLRVTLHSSFCVCWTSLRFAELRVGPLVVAVICLPVDLTPCKIEVFEGGPLLDAPVHNVM